MANTLKPNTTKPRAGMPNSRKLNSRQPNSRQPNSRQLSIVLIAAGSFAGLLGGCSAPDRTATPVVHTFSIANETDKELVWEASQDVLRRQRFSIDRIDRRAGTISTFPLTSQHFFEFWRRDVATPYDWWEASLRTVRRQAQIDLQFDETANVATMTVIVRRELFASPERQYNNSVAAFRMFGDALPSEQTGEHLSASDDYWIADGRDPAMERALLSRIVAYAGG